MGNGVDGWSRSEAGVDSAQGPTWRRRGLGAGVDWAWTVSGLGAGAYWAWARARARAGGADGGVAQRWRTLASDDRAKHVESLRGGKTYIRTPCSPNASSNPVGRWATGNGSTSANPQPTPTAAPSFSALSPTITASAASTPSRDRAISKMR